MRYNTGPGVIPGLVSIHLVARTLVDWLDLEKIYSGYRIIIGNSNVAINSSGQSVNTVFGRLRFTSSKRPYAALVMLIRFDRFSRITTQRVNGQIFI